MFLPPVFLFPFLLFFPPPLPLFPPSPLPISLSRPSILPSLHLVLGTEATVSHTLQHWITQQAPGGFIKWGITENKMLFFIPISCLWIQVKVLLKSGKWRWQQVQCVHPYVCFLWSRIKEDSCVQKTPHHSNQRFVLTIMKMWYWKYHLNLMFHIKKLVYSALLLKFKYWTNDKSWHE